ncbi:hypothetical protein [Mycoplana rhizolycopersici]|uniref:Trypsin-like peptidase domain-containing protein n=1 Tax=Mycoplana rhizolycopersici TaxID=2746702 RepID=A0ABX2QHV4_9HYPH|nr:hypothetical protein [Rhizobium rhizolycopersici]NVP55951.1 hypothetical protein [Rhizobium rhizolycopersici]
MNYALPFLVRRSDTDNGIGSAFLAKRNGNILLVTCAHTPQGKHVTDDFHNWPREFELRIDGAWKSFPLFTKDGDPSFTFKRWADGTIADMLSFELSESVISSLAEKCYVFQLDKPYLCKKGQKLVAYGYPDAGAQWPPDQQKAKGKALDNVVHCTIKAELGYSGGPVVANGTELAGLLIGSNDEATCVAIAANLVAKLFD